MKHTVYFSRAMLAVVVGAASISMAHAYPAQITYVTGGIGDEEREAMKSVKNDYNLSILSAAKSGEYVGDTRVVISDRSSGQPLIDTDAGPLFYAQLPPGRYVIEGESQGQIKKQNVTIAENKPAAVRFSWNNAE